MNWYLLVLKKYAQFTGRSRRKEYWMFMLVHVIILIILNTIDTLVGIAATGLPIPIGPLYGIYAIATLLPTLGVSVRRLHDIGKSGWFILLTFIPLIGQIWLLVLLATEGNPGENQYGSNPKENVDAMQV